MLQQGIKILVLLSLLGCTSAQYLDLSEEIEYVLESEEITPAGKAKIVNRLVKKQKTNTERIAKERDSLKSENEKNQWKVNIIDGAIYALIALAIGIILYTWLKLKSII